MPFSEVNFYNFRNIQNQKLPVHYEQVFFIGQNGQGKTNFLEALYVIAYGRSFRKHRDENMVTNGCNEMSLSAKWYMGGERHTDTDILITYTHKKKDIYINDKIAVDRKELLEHIPAIIFSHDDIEFVKGTPEQRRWFFNQCLSRYQLSFVDILQSYTKVIKNRNQILRGNNYELIGIYDEQAAEYGLAIMQARTTLIAEFNALFTPLFELISGIGEPVSIEYRPSWKVDSKEAIVNVLESRIDNDIQMRTTTSGPQRDKFLFKIHDRDFLYEASTGQVRMMSLILRVAQAQLYAKMSGKKPLLLVDDVLLEIDGEKREKFMEELPPYDQIFFTFLPNEDIGRYRKENSISYAVNKGEYTVIP